MAYNTIKVVAFSKSCYLKALNKHLKYHIMHMLVFLAQSSKKKLKLIFTDPLIWNMGERKKRFHCSNLQIVKMYVTMLLGTSFQF